jgi:signal transduction histidine kinase
VSTDRNTCVGILAPTGRDAALAAKVLGRWNVEAEEVANVEELVVAIKRGLGAVIVAEEALTAATRDAILGALERQPGWSDLPLIVLTAEGELSRTIAEGIERIATHSNVTLLERPVRMATLITTVQSALRARLRQYDVRDHLAALSVARAEAEEANRAKVEFLAMMSHELRTPLNAIGGYAELLEMGIHGEINDEQREDLARIQRSQRHLLGLINGVLNFARIERGTVDYRIAKLVMSDVITTVETLVAPQAARKNIELAFDGCSSTLIALGDREKVQQILLNLLGNAIKFTEAGGRIKIECQRRSDRIAVTVDDNGRGIPQDKLDAVFEPFVQVDSRLTRSQEGVGLGLAISRDLARGMGGDLMAESELGKGSRFTLLLKSA